jgi:ankyrin repeat protein
VPVVEILLAKDKVDVNAVNQHGNTPLHFAVDQGSLEIVKMLVARADTKVGEINRGFLTPLDKATTLGQTEIAEFLESRGAPRNRTKARS